MAIWPTIEKDPFRLFFPLGALLAIAGVLPWAAGIVTHASYPRDLHRILMIDGFLLAFVAGFLMTAITRFTGTHFATKWEIVGVLIAILIANMGALFPSQSVSFLFSAIAVLQIALFAFRRFRKKTVNPPYTFIFIGVGLLFWLVGNLGLFFVAIGLPLPEALLGIFNDLFSNGAIMSLVLGVGGRLLPGIFGWEEIVLSQRQRYETKESYLCVVPRDVWIAMFVFIASFLIHPLLSLRWCYLLRGMVALYFAITYWRIHRFPKSDLEPLVMRLVPDPRLFSSCSLARRSNTCSAPEFCGRIQPHYASHLNAGDFRSRRSRNWHRKDFLMDRHLRGAYLYSRCNSRDSNPLAHYLFRPPCLRRRDVAIGTYCMGMDRFGKGKNHSPIKATTKHFFYFPHQPLEFWLDS